MGRNQVEHTTQDPRSSLSASHRVWRFKQVACPVPMNQMNMSDVFVLATEVKGLTASWCKALEPIRANVSLDVPPESCADCKGTGTGTAIPFALKCNRSACASVKSE